MTNIELYINNKLCDLINPETLGVRLNRVLINPAELSTKDAQYSYSVTIPSSMQNDAIFGYANVEETKNKFNQLYNARLYVDGVKVFDGRFKINEIDAEGSYKGNLLIPAPKTIKEIFGEKKMNEAGEWKINIPIKKDAKGKQRLASFPEFISEMNQKDHPECIFPLALYGLLPKQLEAKNEDSNLIYINKQLWDDTVRLGIEDFPPSINCLRAIQQIFQSLKDDKGKSATITGSAFSDERLKELYMSYQNPVSYQQPWNWGQLGRIHLSGTWTNIDNDNNAIWTEHLETEFAETNGDLNHAAVNIFNSKNGKVDIVEDWGNNVFQYNEYKDDNKEKYPTPQKRITSVNIPMSGLYKISLKADIQIVDGNKKFRSKSQKYNGLRFAYGNSDVTHNQFFYVRYELKLLRSRGDADFDIDDCVIDGIYFRNNQKQEIEYSNDSKVDVNTKFSKSPMYFPQPAEDAVLFVDPAQNPKFVCGFRWGSAANDFRHNPLGRIKGLYTVLAAKHGFSWDNSIDTFNYCAIQNNYGYMKYGQLANDDANEESVERGYTPTDKYIIPMDMGNLTNRARAKQINANPGNGIDDKFAEGEAHIIMWLEKGEKLALADVSDIGYWRDGGSKGDAYIKHAISFDLEIEPYRTDKEWLKMKSNGTGEPINKDIMKWDGDSNLRSSNLDLIKFLPSEQKIDEWMDNFCKAFNLQLTQPAPYQFRLDVKQQQQIASAMSVIDLDDKVSVIHRTNQPLGLPSAYKLGFKINKEEEGYVKSGEEKDSKKDDGGGTLETGNIDGKELAQTSSFSYNWFKLIKHNGNDLFLPVITHSEIWKADGTKDYAEMMKKLYTNYAQRFWYRNSIYNAGDVWDNGRINKKSENAISLAMVSNQLHDGKSLELSYHDKPNTILTTFFNVVVTNDSNYTLVECYLTPDEYDKLDGSCYLKLNDDLYYIASVDGYDPIGRNPTKLKLIRKV